MLKVKSCAVKVKDVDTTGRRVIFYGSAFGNKDSDGDIVTPGAYTKTISDSGPGGSARIKHWWQHDVRSVMGKFESLQQDSFGLLCDSAIAKTALGNDALALYELDLLEHSIGYVPIVEVKTAQGNELREIRLREVSSVTLGANPLTPLVGMKGEALEPLEEAAKLEADRAKLYKALRTGNLTDETYEALELGSQHIDRRYRELLQATTATKDGQPEQSTGDGKQPERKSGLSHFLHSLQTQ